MNDTLTFHQRSGEYYLGPTLFTLGWAGCGLGKNNPEMQHVRMIGPLPRGRYRIGAPELASTGAYSLRLHPCPETEMFGRDGFLIHGPAVDASKRGQESHGCPIMHRICREQVVRLGVEWLEVVE